MLTGCAECAELWSAYHAATIEENYFQEKLAAAKLKSINPELIVALSAQVKTLSLIIAAESRQVAAHRATHMWGFIISRGLGGRRWRWI
jgi:hypothetical protein